MRLLISFALLLGLVFFSACSDVNQDISPVAPGINKVSYGPGPVSQFIYDYLQKFEYMEASQSDAGSITGVTLELKGTKGPEDIIHAFAVLNYATPGLPGSSHLVFLGKPNSLTVNIPGYSPQGLDGTEAYVITSSNGLPISESYEQFQSFEVVGLQSFATEGGVIKVNADQSQWGSSLIDVFAEVSTKSGKYLVYLQKPSSASFTFPVEDAAHVIGIRLFGRYQ